MGGGRCESAGARCAARWPAVDLRALLVEHGLVHPSLTAEAVVDAFLATFEGFLRAGAAADPRRWADLLEGTVERAFSSGRRLPKSTREKLTRQVIDVFAGH
jgi:hypothetical protein